MFMLIFGLEIELKIYFLNLINGGKKMEFKLSNQAIGAIMMALQKGIMEQMDITDILQEFNLVEDSDGLVVQNPPIFAVQEASEEEASA